MNEWQKVSAWPASDPFPIWLWTYFQPESLYWHYNLQHISGILPDFTSILWSREAQNHVPYFVERKTDP